MFRPLAARGHSAPLRLGCGTGREACRPAHCRCPLGATLAASDHRRASVVVGICDLAVQAVKAFVHVDLSAPLDCADGADSLADPASRTAFRMPLQPIEHAHPAEYREAAAERANESAIEPFDKDA